MKDIQPETTTPTPQAQPSYTRAELEELNNRLIASVKHFGDIETEDIKAIVSVWKDEHNEAA